MAQLRFYQTISNQPNLVKQQQSLMQKTGMIAVASSAASGMALGGIGQPAQGPALGVTMHGAASRQVKRLSNMRRNPQMNQFVMS